MTDVGQWFGFVELAPGAPLQGEVLTARPDEGVSVTMQVAGGPPEQRYRFDFSLAPDGSASCVVNDAAPPADRSAGSGASPLRVQFDARDLRGPSLDLIGKASRAPMRPPAFPPDSLVGLLRIETPQGKVGTYFMADPEQAITAGLPPPDAVRALAESIYKACEQAAGSPALRP